MDKVFPTAVKVICFMCLIIICFFFTVGLSEGDGDYISQETLTLICSLSVTILPLFIYIAVKLHDIDKALRS